MLPGAHIAIGAGLGTVVGKQKGLVSKALIYIGIFALHFFCDWIPHWNFYFNGLWETAGVFVDIFGGIIFCYFIFRNDLKNAGIGAFVSILPDVLQEIEKFFGTMSPLRAFHEGIQGDMDPIPGVAWQIVVVLAIAIAYRRRKTKLSHRV